MDYHKELKKKMSASYERQVKQWMASDPAQLIAAAEDIAAIRFIHENLVDTISDEDASFLLTLDDPLGDVSSKWVEENGSDMVHDDDNLVFLSALKLLEQLTEKGLLTVDEAEKSRIELERKLRPTLLFA